MTPSILLSNWLTMDRRHMPSRTLPRLLQIAISSKMIVCNRRVEIKFRGASRTWLNHNLHAIDATPPRWRGGVGLTRLDSVIRAASSRK